MKPIEEMTQEEIQKLISYKAKNQIIYYQYITQISQGGSIHYNDKEFRTLNKSILNEIIAGKALYEAYALKLTQSDAKHYLTDTAEQVLEDKFANQIDNTINSFNETFETLKTTFTGAVDTLSESTEMLNTLHDLKSSIKTTVEDLDLKTVQSKIDSKINEFKPVREELHKVAADSKQVIESLKALFKD